MSARGALRRILIWGPVAAYLALIFYLSAQSQIGWAASYPDVLLHGGEYALLAVLLARGLNDGLGRPVPRRLLAVTWALCLVYGLSDEFHQAFVPGRTSDWRDVVSDVTGAALALLALSLAQRILFAGRSR